MGLFDLFGNRGPAAWRDITVDQFAAERSGARLVDVREPDEFAAGHIEGSELVPLSGVAAAARDWDRNQKIIMICRSGNRSGSACHMLSQLGFTDLVNLAGGMIAWQQSGLPIGRGLPR